MGGPRVPLGGGAAAPASPIVPLGWNYPNSIIVDAPRQEATHRPAGPP